MKSAYTRTELVGSWYFGFKGKFHGSNSLIVGPTKAPNHTVSIYIHKSIAHGLKRVQALLFFFYESDFHATITMNPVFFSLSF